MEISLLDSRYDMLGTSQRRAVFNGLCIRRCISIISILWTYYDMEPYIGYEYIT